MSDILTPEELQRIAALRSAQQRQTAAGLRRAVAGTGAGAAGIPLQALDLPNARVGGLTAAQAEQLKRAYAALLDEGQKVLGDFVSGREKDVLATVGTNRAKIDELIKQVVSSSGSIASAEAGARGDLAGALTNQLGGAYQDASRRYLDAVERAVPEPVAVKTNQIVAAYNDRIAANTAGPWVPGIFGGTPTTEGVSSDADQIAIEAKKYLESLVGSEQGVAAELLLSRIPGLRDVPSMAPFVQAAATALNNTPQLQAAANAHSKAQLEEMVRLGVGADASGHIKKIMGSLGLTPERVQEMLDTGKQVQATVGALAPLGGEDVTTGMRESVDSDRALIRAEMDRLGDVAAQAGRPETEVAKEAITSSPEFAAFRERLTQVDPAAALAPPSAVLRQYLKTGAEALEGSRRAAVNAGKALRSGLAPAAPAAPEAPATALAAPEAAPTPAPDQAAVAPPEDDLDPLRRGTRNLARMRSYV